MSEKDPRNDKDHSHTLMLISRFEVCIVALSAVSD